ncbi:MAG: helix-turn-helix domain-containing protein [Acidimicrobiaceae bacterium]|nr:helix-turn-helix domain-containing protein [Acidimicrobiaceae bacterium]
MRLDPTPTPGAGAILAGVLLRTAREALGCAVGELAEAAGCAEDLVRRIESGDLDPTLDTVERILNASGLEVRAGPAPPGGRYSGAVPDPGEVARVRAAIEAERALREDLGAPPAGPPAGAQPHWGGEDPAPARHIGAAEGRHDAGGWASVLVRSAIAETPGGAEAFAVAAGVDAEALGRICAGVHRPTVAELAGLLERAGTGLRVRLEVYDEHDDGLHLSAVADPERYRRIKARAEEIFASARPA